MYLMERTLYKIQYVGKAEAPFNLRLNNQRSDVSSPNTLPPCCHFAQSNHDFNRHAKLTLTETITSRNKPTEVTQDNLRKRENFWINT